MKIRIRGNSVRLRLTKTEVDSLAKTGSFSEKIVFPNNTLVYTIIAKEAINTMEASYIENIITIYIPKKDSLEWPTNTIIGHKHSLKIDAANSLSILVEKDFVCMDETVEDQSDNYPNPKALT
ncbi:hypothetical protein CLV91_0353 [Maribacter vaceletii]|uniref:Uncharacterized protein n=1 Tax=Maribacter vaceletii TaxID=1206816 RepID=A0A495EBL5_9FLAO|nr:hypothetical protein [Maribacter vaceletii]RKR14278.1 hypothetical protein CLV91_0353 [Maribacter vaceletii]